MKMTVILTNDGYNKMAKELNHLTHDDWFKIAKLLEETRPIGCSDEFPPEYLNALDLQNRVEKKIADLRSILNDCEIFNKRFYKENKIGFGSKVTINNCNTNKKYTYSLVSQYESDIQNGFMSIDAPFALEMKGLSEGDMFEFNNNEYEIVKITCID